MTSSVILTVTTVLIAQIFIAVACPCSKSEPASGLTTVKIETSYPTPCGCVSPCGCNSQLILPPPVSQLPCGLGFLEAGLPLVASAYGAYDNCGTCSLCTSYDLPLIASTCGNCGYGYGNCGCGNANCGCGYSNYGYGYGNAGLPVISSCGCTLATPVCPSISSLAYPVIL